MKLYRGPTLDLQADQRLQVDLEQLGLPPESHALTLTGLDPAETIIVDSSYTTPHSEMKSFPLWSPLGAAAPDHYVTVDASQRQPDDITSVAARVLGPFANGQRPRRSAGIAMRTPAAQTLQLPPLWTAPAPTIERSAVPRATFTILIMAPTLGTSDYLASFVTPSSAHIVSAVVRQGYALGAPSVTITTPDLSGLPGWTADMGLVPTEPVSWDLEWIDRNMPRETPAVDGRRILDSEILGRLTP